MSDHHVDEEHAFSACFSELAQQRLHSSSSNTPAPTLREVYGACKMHARLVRQGDQEEQKSPKLAVPLHQLQREGGNVDKEEVAIRSSASPGTSIGIALAVIKPERKILLGPFAHVPRAPEPDISMASKPKSPTVESMAAATGGTLGWEGLCGMVFIMIIVLFYLTVMFQAFAKKTRSHRSEENDAGDAAGSVACVSERSCLSKVLNRLRRPTSQESLVSLSVADAGSGNTGYSRGSKGSAHSHRQRQQSGLPPVRDISFKFSVQTESYSPNATIPNTTVVAAAHPEGTTASGSSTGSGSQGGDDKCSQGSSHRKNNAKSRGSKSRGSMGMGSSSTNDIASSPQSPVLTSSHTYRYGASIIAHQRQTEIERRRDFVSSLRQREQDEKESDLDDIRKALRSYHKAYEKRTARRASRSHRKGSASSLSGGIRFPLPSMHEVPELEDEQQEDKDSLKDTSTIIEEDTHTATHATTLAVSTATIDQQGSLSSQLSCHDATSTTSSSQAMAMPRRRPSLGQVSNISAHDCTDISPHSFHGDDDDDDDGDDDDNETASEYHSSESSACRGQHQMRQCSSSFNTLHDNISRSLAATPDLAGSDDDESLDSTAARMMTTHHNQNLPPHSVSPIKRVHKANLPSPKMKSPANKKNNGVKATSSRETSPLPAYVQMGSKAEPRSDARTPSSHSNSIPLQSALISCLPFDDQGEVERPSTVFHSSAPANLGLSTDETISLLSEDFDDIDVSAVSLQPHLLFERRFPERTLSKDIAPVPPQRSRRERSGHTREESLDGRPSLALKKNCLSHQDFSGSDTSSSGSARSLRHAAANDTSGLFGQSKTCGKDKEGSTSPTVSSHSGSEHSDIKTGSFRDLGTNDTDDLKSIISTQQESITALKVRVESLEAKLEQQQMEHSAKLQQLVSLLVPKHITIDC